MAASNGLANHPLVARLLASPGSFRFAQAVRIVLRASAEEGRKVAIGDAPSRGVQPVRFEAPLSMLHPGGELVAARIDQGSDDRVVLVTPLASLVGVGGALPLPIASTLMVKAAEHSGERHPRVAFYELFSSRLASMLFRCIERSRPALAHEAATRRSEDQPGSSSFERVAHALLGVDSFPGIDPDHLVGLGPLLLLDHGSSWRLVAVIRACFAMECSIREFVPVEVSLPEDQQTTLGPPPGAAGRHPVLGEDAVLGDRVLDLSRHAELRAGPLSLQEFRGFLPDGTDFRRLRTLVAAFAGPAVCFAIRLVVRGAECPGSILGGQDARLGWSAWLEPGPEDRDDAAFDLQSDSVARGAG
jgi:type VI secretion system protein ImpH